MSQDQRAYLSFSQPYGYQSYPMTTHHHGAYPMHHPHPIVSLLSTAAGRKLNKAEIRLLDGLDTRETTAFVKLMQDVVGGMMQNLLASIPWVTGSMTELFNVPQNFAERYFAVENFPHLEPVCSATMSEVRPDFSRMGKFSLTSPRF
jgi:hypothetical protein